MEQHDVSFRMSGAMLQALDALAQSRGVSIGDLIRDAVSRDLRVRGALAAPGLPANPDKLRLLRVRPRPPEAVLAN